MRNRAVDARMHGPPAADVSLLRYAALLTGNRADAEDLVQEAKARLLAEARTANKEIEFIDSYLRKTLTNAFLNRRLGSTLGVGSSPPCSPHGTRSVTRSAPCCATSSTVRCDDLLRDSAPQWSCATTTT